MDKSCLVVLIEFIFIILYLKPINVIYKSKKELYYFTFKQHIVQDGFESNLNHCKRSHSFLFHILKYFIF